jgi:YfiH family protein
MYKSDKFPFLYFFNLFKPFEGELTAGITGRNDGVSSGPFSSFNTALHCGDDPEAVLQNRQKLCTALGIEFQSYTCASQVHEASPAIIWNDQKGAGRDNYNDSLNAKDALITGEKGIMLNIHVADCIPLILYDAKQKIGALAHAGWKGTVKNIAVETVTQMIRELNCHSENIYGAIGPSIGSCCFEIGEETAETIKNSFPYQNPIVIQKDGRYFADLQEANREQLLNCGISEDHIETARICTSCENGDFYSYRADKGTTGRFSAFLYIK